MKKLHLLTIAALFALALIITACAPAATPAAETQPVLQPSATAMPPEPTQTAAPTATPEPVVCMITFDSDRDKNREIYKMGPDGKDPVNLSNDPGEDFDPAWSPDGSQIAFVSNRANEQGGGQFIYVMDADGNDVRQLSQDPNSDLPDWSHDGSQITYTSNDDIYVINADGSGTSTNLTNSPQKDWKSTWSPDGSKIAWLSGGDGNWNIF
ncbi:MAG: hypothetical protein HGA53_10980, partial [Anaerolineaceae bacterium]|nr:hypothetical protein [Anaerolineaceae bacterium]